MYHGWNDQLIRAAEQHRLLHEHHQEDGLGGDRSIRAAVHGAGHDALRGRRGAEPVRALAALEQWREHGTSPVRMLATHATGGIAIARARCVPIRAWPFTRAAAAGRRREL